MNTNALYELLSLISHDYQKSQIVQLWGQMTDALNHMISNPGHPQFQVTFASTKAQIVKALSSSELNEISPKQRLMAIEMGIDDLLGDRLNDQLSQLIEENQMTPAAIQKPLQALHSRINKFNSSASNLIKAFDEIVPTSDSTALCEMGVLIPNAFTHSDLSSIIEEISDFELIYKNIQEVCELSRSTPKIVSMSTTDPLIVISTSISVCACFAMALEWILNQYKSILEIRQLRSDLMKKGISESAVKAIDDEANGKMESAVTEIVEKAIKDFHKGTDKGRVNELKLELKHNLLKLAFKVDNGFAYEVKVKRPETDDQESVEQKQCTIIESAAKNIEYTNLTGHPVLRLPPPSASDTVKSAGTGPKEKGKKDK